ncbi:MAG: outer membrane protein assembly factor BamD [Proteobacteria bacterium]|nr:MAG: outer membrane protein assembly factor BamD [Pseudomonadota bacterium]
MGTKSVRLALALSLALLTAACASTEPEDAYANLPAATLLQYGDAALDERRYAEALEIYKKLESRYPYGRPAEQAQLNIAYAYFKNEEPELAVAAADRFIRLHPTHDRVDYAYYLNGLASYRERTGFVARLTGADDLSDRDTRPIRNAYNTFRELVTRFPDSPYAADARQRIIHLVNVLAKHDITVARYYLSHGAYVAVLNRAKKVLEDYQRTPAVEDALGLMAIAYREMGLEELMQDTVKVLRSNFPESSYLAQI